MGRHRHRRRRRRHLVWLAAAAVILGSGTGWIVATQPGAPAGPPAAAGLPANVTPTPATAPYRPPHRKPTPERIYLAELAEAGVDLTHEERLAALDIARQHIGHGHLVGMREWIRDDFRKRIPRLTEQQTEAAKVAVEHHFQRVTGLRQ